MTSLRSRASNLADLSQLRPLRRAFGRHGLAVSFLLIPGLFAVSAEPISPRQVLGEYTKALDVLEARSAHCRGEGILTSARRGPDAKLGIQQTFVQFGFSGHDGYFANTDAMLVDDVGPPSPPRTEELAARYPQTVMIYNNQYSSILLKKSPSAPYRIDRLEPLKGSKRTSPESTVLAKGGHLIKCTTMSNGWPIANMIRLPDIRIDRVAEVPGDGSRRLRVDFSFPEKVLPARAFSRVVSGWLIVSPDLGWILDGYGQVSITKTGDRFTATGRVDYRHATADMAVPARSDRREYAGKYDVDPERAGLPVEPIFRESFDFMKLVPGGVTARDFTLTAYGLPEFGQSAANTPSKPRAAPAEQPAPTPTEPPPISRGSTSTAPWWIFGLATLALGVAILARRLGSGRPASRMG